MADAPDIILTDQTPLLAAEQTGTIYVIDLVGFSQLTEDRISSGEKSGTEMVTQLVTRLFSALIADLAHHNIEYGGMAGDALIAWQADHHSPLSETQLNALAMTACDNLWAGLTCRTARAHGPFRTGRMVSGPHHRPLVWGSAVTAAFEALATKARHVSEPSVERQTLTSAPDQMLAAASVSERWSIVIRALTPEACGHVTAAQLDQTFEACREICDAISAEIDNIVQDDKGLLIIIVLPQSRQADRSACDTLLAALTKGRRPLFDASQTAATFGTLFRCRPQFSDHAVTITIGHPINQAAKTLGSASPLAVNTPAPMPSTRERDDRPLIGRAREAQKLLEACTASKDIAQTATLIGAAGIGKTALVQSLLHQEPSAIVIDVSPGSRHLPFGCAQDLAETCDLPAETVLSTRRQAALAQALPEIVIIENWQWCDDESKRLIRRLQADRRTGLLLISSRQEVTDLDAATEIRLVPLDLAQTGQLIETVAPGVLDDAQKRSVFEVSSGTPFWLVQAALHCAEAAEAETALTAISGLVGLLTARAQSLSDPAIALWRLYCAWRLPLEFETARDLLAKFDIAVSPEHLEELLDLGWVAADPTLENGDLRPAHDILADWGGTDLPPSFERSLHAQIARAVAQLDGSPSRIARHWQTAQKDLRAAIWYDRAAHVADRAGAHRLTVAHLAQSEDLARDARQSNQTRALDRLALSATANWGIGRLRRAKQTLVKFDAVAKNLSDSERKRNALQRASAIQSEVGQFSGNSNLIFSGMYRGWRNSGGPISAYEVKARRDGFIYYLLGLARLPVAGRFNHLIRRAHENGEYRSQTLLGCAAGSLHMSHCEWDKAEAVLTSCHRAIARTDDQQMLGVAQCLLALCALYQGQADRSYRWFEGVAEIGRAQDHHMFDVWGAYGKAEAQLYAGDLTQAKRNALDAKRKSVGLGDHQSLCIIEGVLAQIAAAETAYQDARKHLRNAVRIAAKLPPTNFSTLEGIAAAAQVGCDLVAVGQPSPEIERMIQTGRKALKSYAKVFHVARPRLQYVDGLIARTKGDAKGAQRKFEKARQTALELGMNYERDLACAALDQSEERQHGVTAEIY